MIGGISYFHEFAYDLIAENERILASTFDAAIAAHRDGHLQRIVVMSSSMVYESATVFPTPEGAQLTSPPPISTYGFQKLAAEYFAKGAWEQYQLPYTIVRPFNCVGIGERRALRDTDIMSGNVKLALSHVVPDLVLKVLKGQDPLHILGDGSQVRHYTYGGDLAHGIRLAMESDAAVNEDFNLSTAASTTVLELAEAIWHKVHGAGPPVPTRLRPAVRARRPAARPGRAQGARGARLRGDDVARRDARRGHPVDPRRGRGRAAVTERLPELYDARFDEREVSAEGRASGARSSPFLQRYDRSDAARSSTSPATAATSSRFAHGIGALGDRHPGHVGAALPADVRFVQCSGLDLATRRPERPLRDGLHEQLPRAPGRRATR